MYSLKGIYAITDTILTPYSTILAQVESALKGGVKIIQLRDKTNSDYFLEDIALALKKLIKKYNALFIINDRVKLANKIDADGVHLGDTDSSLKQTRSVLKNKIIGVSCYGDIEKAKISEDNGADYVAFGAVFNSSIKTKAIVIGVDIFNDIKKHINIPICAIGGISANNISSIRKDIEMKAVISSIWQKDIISQAKKLNNLI